MIIFKEIPSLKAYLESFRSTGRKTGFVPTMGALHQGHMTLIHESVKQADITVCSIFVNPVQFNDPADFEKYPITLEQDIRLLEKAGTGVLFLPEVKNIYPQGLENLETYPLGALESVLEGAYRPGHFQGVCQVVSRLLDAVQPDLLFMGQKDFQQCSVVQRLLDIKQSNAQLITVPTVRETSGLAMSSRNMRLSESDKLKAVHIYNNLTIIQQQYQHTPLDELTKKVTQNLEKEGFKVDYVAIVNGKTLQKPDSISPDTQLVALIAAWLSGVRLIDNKLISNG